MIFVEIYFPLSESVEEEEETGCQQQGFSSVTEGEELKYAQQCCGSGAGYVCFVASRIRIH
jgi:hypothetical protein